MFSRTSRGKQENWLAFGSGSLIEKLRIVECPSTRVKLTVVPQNLLSHFTQYILLEILKLLKEVQELTR